VVATQQFFRYDVPHENTNPQHTATPTPSLVFSSVPEREAIFTASLVMQNHHDHLIIKYHNDPYFLCAYLQESLSYERESAKTPPAAGLP
jgi:hypothetical protein